MNCCPNCFNDKEAKGFIYSNSTKKGDCDFCGSKGLEIIDCREFESNFLPIVDLYEVSGEPTGLLMYESIQDEWGIFNIEDKKVIENLLSNIFEDSSIIKNIFSDPIHFKSVGKGNIEEENKWEDFTNEIKFTNRFFLSKTLDLELLKDLLNFLAKPYRKGKIFYRGRISENNGHEKDSMGKPLPQKSTAGRANPRGIPYLYLAHDLQTTVHESRASHNDYITVGQFKLNDDINIVTLKDIESISPFVLGSNIQKFIIHKKYLLRLEEELSKPIYRSDADFDYLPTQYLCEFVKSQGYDAIEYSSSLDKGGSNLAVFNDSKVECVKVEVFKIESINYDLKKIK